MSVLPQVRALPGASDGRLDLVEHERVEVRFIAGVEYVAVDSHDAPPRR